MCPKIPKTIFVDAMAMLQYFWEPNQECIGITCCTRCGCHTLNCTQPGVCTNKNTFGVEVVLTMNHMAARVYTRQPP